MFWEETSEPSWVYRLEPPTKHVDCRWLRDAPTPAGPRGCKRTPDRAKIAKQRKANVRRQRRG